MLLEFCFLSIILPFYVLSVSLRVLLSHFVLSFLYLSAFFPYTSLFRSGFVSLHLRAPTVLRDIRTLPNLRQTTAPQNRDRKSTRLNSSHLVISYAVFCLKKKTN